MSAAECATVGLANWRQNSSNDRSTRQTARTAPAIWEAGVLLRRQKDLRRVLFPPLIQGINEGFQRFS